MLRIRYLTFYRRFKTNAMGEGVVNGVGKQTGNESPAEGLQCSCFSPLHKQCEEIDLRFQTSRPRLLKSTNSVASTINSISPLLPSVQCTRCLHWISNGQTGRFWYHSSDQSCTNHILGSTQRLPLHPPCCRILHRVRERSKAREPVDGLREARLDDAKACVRRCRPHLESLSLP